MKIEKTIKFFILKDLAGDVDSLIKKLEFYKSHSTEFEQVHLQVVEPTEGDSFLRLVGIRQETEDEVQKRKKVEADSKKSKKKQQKENEEIAEAKKFLNSKGFRTLKDDVPALEAATQAAKELLAEEGYCILSPKPKIENIVKYKKFGTL